MKEFCTHRKQIKILRDKGLSIPKGSGGSAAARILEKNNYYSVINGYKDLFLDPTAAIETYIGGTTLTEIYALYCFDIDLRNLLLPYILRIENMYKTILAYEFSKKYGHRDYLVQANFDCTRNNYGDIIGFIANIQKEIAKHASSGHINHYLTNHGYIPLWVLVNSLSLGTVSKFYSLMKQVDRQAIARRFGIRENELENALKILTYFRNVCAHGNRMYCFKTRTKLNDNAYHARMAIPKVSGTYLFGKDDLLSLLIIIDWLLKDRKEMKKLIKALDGSIALLTQKLNIITINTVMEKMGFPLNWNTVCI